MACTDDPVGGTDSDSTVSTNTSETGDTGSTDTQVVLEPAARLTGDRPINLLVISLDTLRRDYVGFHSGKDTTPVLDALMADGVVLGDHAPCANWTYPSLLCTQTGLNSVDLGVHPPVGEIEEAFVYEYPTQDALLAQAGYSTALTSANAFFQPYLGTGKDFDEVTFQALWAAEPALDNALSQLETLMASGGPWYQHVHLFDPHTPYTAPEQYELGRTDDLDPIPFDLTTQDGMDELMKSWNTLSKEEQALSVSWVSALYAADIRYMDAQIGRFLETVDTAGGLDHTLVLFWSDHGEQFYEDNRFGHGVDVHDEEVDGLAFFWMADGGLEPTVFERPTTQIDLMPTIWDLLGMAPESHFMGTVAGMAETTRGRLSAHWAEASKAALAWQVGDDKLVYRWDGTVELYDRATDPLETVDLSEEDPEKVRALWEGLQPEVAKMAEIHPIPSPVTPDL